MFKKKLFIIVRGFIYRKNWTPLSKRKKYIRNYTINFFDTENNFKKTIDKLSEKYDVNLYFSTYDTTPQEYIEKLKEIFPYCKIIISPEKYSSQFTTVVTALNHIKGICDSTDMILLLRSDIIIKEPLINVISNHSFDKDILYVLAKEQCVTRTKKEIRRTRNITIDVIQIFYGSHLMRILDYFCQPKLKSAHKIHTQIYANVMVPIEESFFVCPSTYLCSYFFEIKYNNTSWWPLERDYGETIYHNKN